jgi:hypothetical protein
MNTTPSIDDLLHGLIVAISDEIVPNLANEKAYATASMMQSMLQEIRQLLPVFDIYLVDEHNDMIRTMRDTAAALGAVEGAEADRIRERAATLGTWADLPAPPDHQGIASAHRELGQALVDTMIDLDVLQRAGETSADAALDVVRGHFGPRYVRDTATIVVGAGMLGRG